MAKNAPYYVKSPVKNFHGRAKGGAIAPWPPLNTPLPVHCAEKKQRKSSLGLQLDTAIVANSK